MPERNQDEHWDFLAADLGAKPAPEPEPEREEEQEPDELETPMAEAETPPAEQPAEEATGEPPTAEAREPQPAEPAPRRRAGPAGDRVVSGFGYRRSTVDWANLARELGVEALEEVPEPIPASESPVAPPSQPGFGPEPAESESVEEVETIVRKSETIETKRTRVKRPEKPVAEGFGAGILDEVEAEAAPPETPAEPGTAEEPPEQRKGRRRRRRKPKRQQQEAEAAETAEAPAAEETEKPSREAEDREEEGRSRGRGRRRGGRKKPSREDREEKEEVVEVEGFAAGLVEDEETAEGPEEVEILDIDVLEEVDEEAPKGKKSRRDRAKRKDRDKDQDEEPRKKKVTHRGIPTWEEAVGFIVASNLENRSKRPDPNGSRHRSGRRRGGDRSGNRGRS